MIIISVGGTDYVYVYSYISIYIYIYIYMDLINSEIDENRYILFVIV